MKVTMERAALMRAMGHLHRVVERRNTIPILGNVLMRASDGVVTLKATDLDMEVTEPVAGNVERAGATTLPAHVFHDIVRKFQDGSQVSLADGDGTCVVKSGRSRFSLQSLPERDFPDLSAGEMGNAFRMKGSTLTRLVDRTQFAISSDETRYYLNGIYFHAVGDEMRMVATDGHRLARCATPLPDGAAGMAAVILPRKAIAEVRKLVDDGDAEVLVEVSSQKARFTVGDVVLVTKLVDGTFPDYERVIPTRNERALGVDRLAFREAVDRVSTIASERGRAVKFSISDGKLAMSSVGNDAGSGHEEMEVEWASEPLEIGFNPKYVLDVVAQLETPTVEIMLGAATDPALVRDRDSSDAVFVLMPMRC